MSWSTSELRVRLAPLNRFKPSSKIFYWPFQGGTSFVDLLCFCSVLCLLCLCARLFMCALWSPAGKGLTSWLSFVVSAVSLSLSHWYPRSGVVLDCIDSWSLHPYLLPFIVLIECNIVSLFWVAARSILLIFSVIMSSCIFRTCAFIFPCPMSHAGLFLSKLTAKLNCHGCLSLNFHFNMQYINKSKYKTKILTPFRSRK